MTMEKTARNITDLPFNVLIVAGGAGSRMQGEIPKQYLEVGSISVLRRTLNIFLSCPNVQCIKVVINPDHEELYHKAVERLEGISFTYGGQDRTESVYNGLKSYEDNLQDDDIILIHDAARPLVSHDEILSCVLEVNAHGAATVAVPVTNTLKRTDGSYVDRDNLWSIQTPQGFHYGLIVAAHESVDKGQNYTDDTAIAEAAGHKVAFAQGSARNIKITYQEDIAMLQELTAQTPQIRTGQGFDVHSFDLSQPGPVRLCGIDVEHPHKLKGHSDADVALHALTDALLGAIGEGDIGLHFPPSEAQWKGMDSAFFLEEAVKMLHNKGGHINNLDLTLICEAPKLGVHREAMRVRVAEICGIDSTLVNIKATTTEKLGFTGRKEGIAAQAVITVSL